MGPKTAGNSASTDTRHSPLVICLRLGLLTAWMAGIFVFSSQQGSTSKESSGVLVQFVQSLGVGLPIDLLTLLIRKGAHAFAYFVLGVLAFFALKLTRLSLRAVSLSSLAFVLLYAASDEFHQLLVPGRSGEVSDVLLDAAAGAVGILLVHVGYRVTSQAALEPPG